MLEELPTIPLSNQAYILDYYVHPENLHVAKSTVLNYLQLHLPLLEEQQIIDWLTPLTLTNLDSTIIHLCPPCSPGIYIYIDIFPGLSLSIYLYMYIDI